MSIPLLKSKALLAILFLLAALPACVPYGYQPSIMRVPTVDTVRKAEVALSAGIPSGDWNDLYYGAFNANYAVSKKVFIGAQTAGYTRYLPVYGEITGNQQHVSADSYLNFLRAGASGGMNVGVYAKQGAFRFYGQLGNDIEYMVHSFHREEILPNDDVRMRYYRSTGTFTKPWLQGSLVGSTKGRRPFFAEFFLGLRYSQFVRLGRSRSTDFSRPITADEFPVPPANQAAIESTGGLSLHYKQLSLALRLQVVYGVTPHPDGKRWWNTPRTPINFGMAYTFRVPGGPRRAKFSGY